MTFLYGLARIIVFGGNAKLRPKRLFFWLKMTLLIPWMTKQDKETIDKRVEEVPESDKTACRETELVRGYEAQDRRVLESSAHLRTLLL